PVTPGVAGSSPVRSAKISKSRLIAKSSGFCFFLACFCVACRIGLSFLVVCQAANKKRRMCGA
ncbi:hypothetical protein ACLSYI_15415, partial [Bordetella avium]|uniref:hypothetical protein n=1 Tax=Bordetella avium TaxID=521 RepID=UPI003BF7895F